MKITIFSKYKVKYESKYSYQNEEGEFVDGECKWDKTLEGSELMELIVGLIKDEDFIVITSKENYVHIEYFDPMTGEPADYKITYEEVWDEKKN